MEFTQWPSSRTIMLDSSAKQHVPFPRDIPLALLTYAYSPSSPITPNWHDFFEISYVYEGEGAFLVENSLFPVHAGDLFVVGNTQFHTVEGRRSGPMKFVCLYFEPELVYSPGSHPVDFGFVRPFYDQRIAANNIVPGRTGRTAQVLGAMEELNGVLNGRGRLDVLHAKKLLLDILLLLARHYSRARPAPRASARRTANDIKRLEPVFTLMRREYRRRIPVKEAAEAACMNAYSFCKFFKRVTGSTFTDYLTRMRVDHAREEILRGERRISEIALDAGFGSLSYFDRIFKRLTGLSPKQFAHRAARS